MTCHPDCWYCWEEIDQLLQVGGWLLLWIHIAFAAWGARWWQRKLQVDHSRSPLAGRSHLFGEINSEALLLGTAVLFFLFNQQTFGQSLHLKMTARIEQCKVNTAIRDCQALSALQGTAENRASGLSSRQTATTVRARSHRPLLARLWIKPDADAHRSAGRE